MNEYKEIPKLTKEELLEQDTNVKIDLGKRLLKLREEYHYKQGDVAEAIGISRVSLGYYEKGERNIDISVLQKLAKLYNVSTDYLIGISAEKNPKADQKCTKRLKDIGFSIETTMELYGKPLAAKFISDLVTHPSFTEFEHLTYHSRYTRYESMDFEYRSFLISRVLHMITSDILNNWYDDDTIKIKELTKEQKESICNSIETYLKRKHDLEEREKTPTLISSEPDIKEYLMKANALFEEYCLKSRELSDKYNANAAYPIDEMERYDLEENLEVLYKKLKKYL